MKKLFYILLSLVLLTAFSCGNIAEKIESEIESEIEKLTDEDKVEIKYLEDFVKFENHQEMAEYFGEENVEESILWKAEGTVQYNVSILNPENENKVVVYWGMDDELEGADFVESMYSTYTLDGEEAIEGGEAYPTKVGVELGTSITELQEINGEAFIFYGMAWDYGGAVVGLSSIFDGYDLYLGCPEIEKLNEWPDEYTRIIGDIEISSEDKDALSLGLEVVSISYSK